MNTATAQPAPSQVQPKIVTRWGSFDLFRALAAYGVILIHAGIVCNNEFTSSVGFAQACFAWVVPFFLVIAFLFAARSEEKSLTPWKKMLVTRAKRLLVPFALWGIIYTYSRALLYIKTHQNQELHDQFADPLGLLFSGGAMMLYFLPLLFIGLLELRFLAPLLKKTSLPGLWALFVVTFGILQLLITTHNGYDLGTNRAFTTFSTYIAHHSGFFDFNAFAPTRLLLLVVSDLIECAPLILFAFIVLRFQPLRSEAEGPHALFGGLSLSILLLFLLLHVWHPIPYHEAFIFLAGMAFLLLSIVLLKRVPSTPFVATLGKYTFGIYLVHQLVLEALDKAVGHRIPHPVGLLMALVLALLVFAISYGITAIAARCGSFARHLFAIEA